MKFLSKKNKLGFTVLELLIAIVIMSILTAMTVKVLTSMRVVNRDNKRVTDIKEIQAALEMIYKDYGLYPTSITVGQPLAIDNKTYINLIPKNPQPRKDGSCLDEEYLYNQDENGVSYHLKFCLGSKTGDLGSGVNYAIPGDILTCIPDCYLSCNANGSTGSDGCGAVCSNALSACPTGYTCLSNHCIAD